MLLCLLLLLAPQGRPLFYWGARAALIQTGEASGAALEARVLEVHAAREGDALLVRLSFDRRVREALYLPDGRPVSGRLRATLYVDRDGNRATGLAAGQGDLRGGCERRLELGVVSIGADPEQQLEARAVVSATLYSLTPEGRRRRLWQRDDAAHPDEVSAHGEWVELRVPWDRLALEPGARLVLAVGSRAWEGRLP